MKINEMFVSMQGEISVGRLSFFIRTSNCNLQCSFCDTKYARDEGFEISILEIVNQAKYYPNVVITGGEPLLQKDEVAKLINKLKSINSNIRIEIETNGTLQPSAIKNIDNVIFNVSIKLKNSGNEIKDRLKGRIVNWFNQYGANFKFVVDNEDDVDEVNMLVSEYRIKKGSVFLMPKGKTRDEQWAKTLPILNLAKKYGYNFSPRFHILLWDKERGK